MANVIHAGAQEATPGEQRTLEVLAQLPSTWTVVANKILPLNHADSREIDFILIGPHRVVVLDEKSYRGKITGTDEVWTLSDGSTRRSPFNKMDMVAKKLAGLLTTKVPSFPPRTSTANSVIAGVILSNDVAQAQITDPRATRCLMHLSNALEKLLWLDDEGLAAGFDLSQIHGQIRTAIYNDNSARRPARPRQVGLYRIEDTLEERSGCRVFRAKHESGTMRTLYMYENARNERNSLDATIDHHLSALRLLQEEGIVPGVGDEFLWAEEEFRVVPVELPIGIAIGTMPRPACDADAIREIEIAAAAFDALSQVHEKGIIHRAIAPDAVYVHDPIPPEPNARQATPPRIMLDGFVAAHIDHSETIAAKLDAEASFDDPYAAPEILRMKSYAFADSTSDVYSLALVTLERLTNLNVHKLTSVLADDQVIPNRADLWPYLPESAINQLHDAYNAALTLGPYANEQRASATQMATDLAQIARDLRQSTVWQKGPVPGTSYEIRSLLGQGTSARTYLVYDRELETLFAAKQYFGSTSSREQAIREFQILWPLQHPSLPKIIKVDLHSPNFQVVLGWIDGETLRQRIPYVRHDRDAWTNHMHDLLGAVGHLEQHNILHGDIKPENVMVRESDGRAFLIDYGASGSATQPGPITGTPRYWPPEWRLGATRPKDGDRYAVAVTLFEALTGKLPFKTHGADFSTDPLPDPPDDLPADLHKVARVLLRAVSIDPHDRFATIDEFRTELDLALSGEAGPEPGPRAVDLTAMNEWIGNLRRLFRNSRQGNSDNRGLDTEFARDTYVPTALDTVLWPAVLEHKPAVVFLSGNPGDGKTAFLERARDMLRDAGAAILDETDLSGWEASFDNHTWRACFDASESAGGLSADEQLANRLRGHESDAPDPSVTVLVAVNDGRLAEVRDRFSDEFPWLMEQTELALELGANAATIQHPVWIIDLKQRSYVHLLPNDHNPSVMRQMLATMVDTQRWGDEQMDLTGLPVAQNAAALRRPGPDSPAARLEHLLTLAHLRGDRHITVRDLRSALALIITADLESADGADRDRELFPYPWSAKYWQTVFTTDTSRDLVLGELRWLDPARFAHPALERFLYFRHRPEDAKERAKLFIDGQDEPPPSGDDPEALKEWISAVKRRLVFEGTTAAEDSPLDLDLDSLLPYTSARKVIAVLAGQLEAQELLPEVLRGIGRSEGIDEANTSDDLVLRVKKDDDHGIEIVKTFPRDQFELSVVRPMHDTLIEISPRTLRLRHLPSSARVTLNLDILEVLIRLADGLDPTSQELQPLLEELVPFKSRIQRSVSDRVLVIEGDRRHWITKRGETVIRQDA